MGGGGEGWCLPARCDIKDYTGRLPFFLPPTGKSRQKSKNNEKKHFPSNQKRRGVAKLNKSQCKELLDRPIKERLCLCRTKKCVSVFSLAQMYIFLFREVRASVRIYIWSTRIGFTRDKEVVRYSISTTPPFEIINSASCSFKSGPCMTFNTRASALPFLTQSRIVEA